MNLKDQALVIAIRAFENLGFMEWHARVLRELTVMPLPIKEVARRAGMYQYHVRGVLQDLLALQLIEYTRHGIQLVDDWEMLLQLVDCCEGNAKKHCYDWEAAFEISTPKVVALKKKYEFDG